MLLSLFLARNLQESLSCQVFQEWRQSLMYDERTITMLFSQNSWMISIANMYVLNRGGVVFENNFKKFRDKNIFLFIRLVSRLRARRHNENDDVACNCHECYRWNVFVCVRDMLSRKLQHCRMFDDPTCCKCCHLQSCTLR